jgi:hypothetical protein
MIRLGLIQQVYDKLVHRCLYYSLLGSLRIYIWDLVLRPAAVYHGSGIAT